MYTNIYINIYIYICPTLGCFIGLPSTDLILRSTVVNTGRTHPNRWHTYVRTNKQR